MCAVHCVCAEDVETLVEEMVETLVEEMVDAFRSVLIVLPRGPTNDEIYSRFIEETRNCSYNPPFCAPKPPFENMKVPVSHSFEHIGLTYNALLFSTSQGDLKYM